MLSSRRVFYTVSFAEIFFISLTFRLLTNMTIDLKFLADVTLVFLGCILALQALGGYKWLKDKFHENYDKETHP